MNGARKGAAFEREIARRLSRWISKDGKRDDLLWRSAGSGSMATNKRLSGKAGWLAHHGDIVATDEEARFFTDRFSVELKFLSDLQFERALYYGTGSLMDAIQQCFTDSVHSERCAMLIAKANRRPPIVGLTDTGLFVLDMLCNGRARHGEPRFSVLAEVPDSGHFAMVKFLLLDDLLEHTSFAAWHKLQDKPEATWQGV